MGQNHDVDVPAGNTPAERILLFRLEERLHAIRLGEISGVVSCETLREIPGAPSGVLGLAEWRGSVLTVLDLPRYLGCGSRDEPVCLIRLAPPLEHTALYLPASIQLTENRLESQSPQPGWTSGGESVCLVDPSEIVRLVEAAMRESN